MRKWNTLISLLVILLFVFHAVFGGFQLAGIMEGGSALMQVTAWLMLGLIILHALIGCVLTGQTLKAVRKSGVSYFKENKLFWARRISGFAILLFILFHVLIFIGRNEGAFRLNYFGTAQLISQILLVITVAVHVITNVKPVLIAAGIPGLKKYAVDILLVLAILLLLSGAAFVIYYLRWRMI